MCIAFSACSKENLGESEMPYITFGVSSLGVDTKAMISGADFTSANPPQVWIYGVRNNTNKIYDNAQITKQANSSNWLPAEKRQWVAGSSYSFYGYSYSAGTSNPALSSLKIENSGMKITVSQPQSYSPGDMVDYMLSHAYKVADGANYHTVMLYMQHAMACVDISVEREETNHNITVNYISLSNIYRSAVMQCEQQAIAAGNSDGNNVWAIQLQGANDIDYYIDYSADPFPTQSGSHLIGKMTFLAIPQQLSSQAVLTVNYSVDEDGIGTASATEYTQSFNLFNYSPYVWGAGHKINYKLTINTGVQLDAFVSDWIDGGYTEGVIIPTPPQNETPGTQE